MMAQATFTGAGWTFGTTPGSANWFIIDGQTRPFLQSEYSTMIYTSHQVQLIEMDTAANYVLACDVDMSDITVPSQMWGTSPTVGLGFKPLGSGPSFTGSLDGLGHAIYSLYINRPALDGVGFFNGIDALGSVQNLGLIDIDIIGKNDFGGLAGYNAGVVANCLVTGTLIGGSQIGGLAGYNLGIIFGGHTSVVLTGASNTGGLVGYNWGGSVINSSAAGTVAGTDQIGGLVGYNNAGSLVQSFATGDVTGTGMDVGGLMGFNSAGWVNDSYARGNATSSTAPLVGQRIGGFIGQNSGWITNSYATGTSIGSNSVGAFAGWNADTLTGCYWDTTTSGTFTGIGAGTIAGATGVATSGMMLQATFAGWDFSTIWDIKETYTYPFHIWNWFNSPPIAEDDNFTTSENTILIGGNVTEDNGYGPDFDIDGHPLTVVELDGDSGAIGVPTAIDSGAIVTVYEDGTFIYDPNDSFEFLAPGSWEIDEFGYTIYDNNGSYDEATVFVNVTGLDDTPIAFGDSYTTAEDTPLSVNAAAGVLANDFDDDGDPTVAIKVTDPATGVLVLDSNGSFLYTSPADWFGSVNFTYKANDGIADSNTATVFINVTGVNDLPDGTDNTVAVNEDLDYLFAPADFGFTDSDAGDTLSAVRITLLESAGDLELSGADVILNQIITVADISSNLLSFTPAENASGIGYANFRFSVRDSQNGFDPVPNNMTIDVNAVNDAPSAISESYSTVEDITLTVAAPGVLGNDFDIENDTLAAVLDTDVSHGTLTLNANGSFEYIPTAGYIGSDNFTYHANDGTADSNVVAVSINVTAANTAPILDPIGNMTVNETEFFIYHPTATDADNDTLTFSLIAAGSNATFSAGNLTWTPGEDQGPGTYSYTIQVSDGSLTDSETFWITVAEVNRAPSFTAITSKAVAEGNLLGFQTTATDPDIPVNTLSYTLEAGAPAGAGINSTGYFTWTPTEAQGPAVYNITVRVTDNGTPNLFDNFTFAVTVSESNVAPVLGAIGGQAVNEESLLTFTATATDADLPANTLTFSLDAGYPTGASITSGGVFTWTPTEAQGPGFYNITVRVSDGALEDFETFMVTVGEVNQAPVLATLGNQTLLEEVLWGFTVPVTDNDLPSQNLSFSLDAGFPVGAWIGNTTGFFSWNPTEAQGPGFYNITVRVSDGSLEDFETFMITVNEVNQAPVLGAIGPRAVNEGTALAFTATATDPDLPANALTYSLDAGFPTGATINATTGAFSWTPTESQGPGVYSITVRVSDGTAQDFETISVTVNEVNQAPVLGAIGNRIISEQSYYSFMATATDSDMPANTLTFSLDAGYPAGAAISAAGLFTWTPSEVQGPGVYPVTIRVSDGTATDSETFTLTVLDVNVAPIAGNDVFAIDEDSGANALNVRINDIDHDGDTLTVTAVTQGMHGTVTIVGAGLEYEPNADFYGTDYFTYTVSDGNGGADTATVTVTIASVNDDPAAVNDAVTVPEDCGAATIYVMANYGYAPESPETLTLTSGTQGAHGAVVKSADGLSLTYEPALNFWGTDTFTYTISDGHGGTDTATVTVTVYNVNDSPIILTENVTAAVSGTNYRVDYVATDIDGDTLVWNLTTTAVWLSIDPATGVLSGMAEAGSFSVKIIVSDGKGGYGVQTFTIDVEDIDSDGDGVLDLQDAFPDNAAETLDTDGDGTGNGADTDDDADGVLDSDDAFPLNPAESADTDGDGIGNNADGDDDGDGVWDADDSEPLNSAETGMEYEPDPPYVHVLFIFCIVLLIGLIGLAVVWLLTRKN
ncbi:MAG: Ig-like domain-containing protein [Thermoplasmata archaeon]|nr:Ig-like domain-containing protein [Thermoplasmata archaeon]